MKEPGPPCYGNTAPVYTVPTDAAPMGTLPPATVLTDSGPDGCDR
jgi:hypothetical protein